MQSIPKRGFNISKFYDSLKIDSNMFRPFKIIDDTINVQDEGIYIYFQILLIISVHLFFYKQLNFFGQAFGCLN